MRFAVIARDPQVDIYREDDLYGCEIVEADDKDAAIAASSMAELQGIFVTATECSDDMKIGECDLSDIQY